MAQNDVNVKITVDASQAQASTDNYKKRLKELKDEMTALQIETDGLSKASAEQRKRFSELEQEAGKIQDAMGDAAQRVKNLSDDYRGMTVAMEGIGGAVGGITAVQGALNLFGVESEQANESIKKMTSLMGILQGVQNVSKALNKDSALMTALMTAKNKLLTASVQEQTKAQLALNAAKLGMVGAIVAVVAALGTLIYKYASAKSEVAKFNEELNKTASESVAPTIVKVNELSSEWQKLGDNLDAKKKFVEENQKAFNDLGVSINDVNGAENLLVNNTAAFIEAQTLRAKAEAARGKIEELVKEQLEDELEYERIFVDKQTTIWEDLATKFNPYVNEDAFKELHEQNQKRIDDEIKKINEKADAYEASAKEKEKEAGITVVNSEEVAKKQEEERKRQEAIRKAIERKAEEERRYQELVKQTESELAGLDKFISDQSKRFNDVIANIDAEEQALTDMYDNALDSAIKYYGEDSEQVKRLTALRLKALEELEDKREEYRKANGRKAVEEAREAEDAGRKAEDAKLKARIARLEEGTAEYLVAVHKQDQMVEEAELADLERQYDDGIVSKELYEAELDRIHAEHEQKRAELTSEYIKTVNDERQKNIEATWQGAEAIVTQYGNLVNSAMEAELEAVRGNEEEEKAVRKKYAKAQFLQQIGGIAISTAKGIMEAWEAYAGIPYVGPALAAALSGIIGATGLAQTAAAKSAMNNALKAERGGILGGQSHANGGTMLSNGVEAERGEAIINKKSTATFAPLLSEINSYNGYGAPLIKSNRSGDSALVGGVSDETIQKIVSATVAGVTSIPVVVSEHNITEAQRNVGITRERSVL